MITRLSAHGTLAANPLKKRHNPKRGAGGRFVKKRNPSHYGLRNPRGVRKTPAQKRAAKIAAQSRQTSRGQKVGNVYRQVKRTAPSKKFPSGHEITNFRVGKAKRKTSSAIKVGAIYGYTNKKGKHGYKLLRNPGGMSFAGVPIIPVAMGALGAIVLAKVGKKLISKYLAGKIPAGFDKFAPGAVVLASAFLVDKYVKHAQAKEAAKYAAIAAIFMLVEAGAEAAIDTVIDKALSGMGVGGTYFDPFTNQQAGVGGMFANLGYPESAPALPSMGGYDDLGSDLGLFRSQSIYG